MKNLPANQVALGDQIELTGGLIGEVFSAAPEAGGNVRIFIETKSGGMQGAPYKPDDPVKVLESSEGTIGQIKDLKVGSQISWGAKKAEVTGVKAAASSFGAGQKEVALKVGGRQKTVVQSASAAIRFIN